jgi:DinB superfamily
MSHPVVDLLRFTRSEWRRGLRGVTEENGARHVGPMNSIGWIVGHLAWQEQRTFFLRTRGELLFPAINQDFAFGAPMSTPSLKAMRKTWNAITKAADPFLDSLTTKDLARDLALNGKPSGQSLGSAIRRMTFHYWFHIGEIQGIRQMLGHQGLPQYVGNLEAMAPYRPER